MSIRVDSTAAWLKFSAHPNRALMLIELRSRDDGVHQLIESAFKMGFAEGHEHGAHAALDNLEARLKELRK